MPVLSRNEVDWHDDQCPKCYYLDTSRRVTGDGYVVWAGCRCKAQDAGAGFAGGAGFRECYREYSCPYFKPRQ